MHQFTVLLSLSSLGALPFRGSPSLPQGMAVVPSECVFLSPNHARVPGLTPALKLEVKEEAGLEPSLVPISVCKSSLPIPGLPPGFQLCGPHLVL